MYIYTSSRLGVISASAADRVECCGTTRDLGLDDTQAVSSADLCQVRKQAARGTPEAYYGEALTGWQMMAAMSGVSGLKSPTLVNGGLAAAAMQSP
jgi:hypothetical protein